MPKKNYILIAIAVCGVLAGIFLMTKKSEVPIDTKSTASSKSMTAKNTQPEEAVEVKEVNLESADLNFEDDVEDLDTSVDGAEEFDADDLNADTIDEGAF